jgi:hypothetical protein
MSRTIPEIGTKTAPASLRLGTADVDLTGGPTRAAGGRSTQVRRQTAAALRVLAPQAAIFAGRHERAAAAADGPAAG